MSTAVRQIQKLILSEYASGLGLDPQAAYYGGARLRPLPPLDTVMDSVMIVGAYPSARFETVGAMRNVPVGDNLGPFEPERYFDGTGVRVQQSAEELRRAYLSPLGVDRHRCWVTDLVKVFLFKPGHRAKYQELGCPVPNGYWREEFTALGHRSIEYLALEIGVAKPRLVVTLGAEVAGVIRQVEGLSASKALLGGDAVSVAIGSQQVKVMHLAHPGIVMRPSSGISKSGKPFTNEWPTLNREKHIPKLKVQLKQLFPEGLPGQVSAPAN